VEIYTIGFTKSSAEHFFGRLADARIERLLDVRLNNSSQLAAFAKAGDLPYFLQELVGARYEHEPRLAPTQEMLDAYKKKKGSWPEYEAAFMGLMAQRRVQEIFSPSEFVQRTVLLCSEATADRCHRRLVCEFLAQHWPDVAPVHL
jgi:uncharacterized protein (DUF488 family)